jgi:diadenosine tetraphosphate (Ap4A) HIT family hydrolase
MKLDSCELCERDGGQLVLANEWLRVVLVDDPGLPGYARVVWNDHVREMTDLADRAQSRLISTVYAVERAQREVMAPTKVNLASLGNQTPHLHWHVVPRYEDDPYFPSPVWVAARRSPPAGVIEQRRSQLSALRRRIAELVSALASS